MGLTIIGGGGGGGGGGKLKYVFNAENASSHFASHWKAFFKTWKKG